MKEQILDLLEKDARLTAKEIAVLIGEGEETVRASIKELEKDQIICGYSTLINWDDFDKDLVTALIEVKVTPQRDQGFDKIARRIYKFSEVKAVYLMSGGFDLTVIVEGRSIKDIALFVSSKLSPLESVLSTATHFVLKKYKDHGVVLEKQEKSDERMLVAP